MSYPTYIQIYSRELTKVLDSDYNTIGENLTVSFWGPHFDALGVQNGYGPIGAKSYGEIQKADFQAQCVAWGIQQSEVDRILTAVGWKNA